MCDACSREEVSYARKIIAESILVVAQEQAKANEVLAHSITHILVSYKSIERWNGVLPQVSGGAIPFIELGKMQGLPETASTDKK